MNFKICAVFKRSITVELENNTVCCSEHPYEVSLNGKPVYSGCENVFTLEGLLPDTEYEMVLSDQEGKSEQHFRTARESVLLNVRDFGAVGDGVTDDTTALSAAIGCCPPEGTVYLPEGTYLSRPLFLKSHMTLWLEEGAVLLGDPDRSHYPVMPGLVSRKGEVRTLDWIAYSMGNAPESNREPSPKSDRELSSEPDREPSQESDREPSPELEYSFSTWEGNPDASFASLLSAYEAEGLDIVGQGTVDGNGSGGDWWIQPKLRRTAWRPNTIFLVRCRDVRLQGITVRNSPSWTIHPYYSDRISLYNVTIWNPSDSPNTDGFDPESCRDVLLLGTRISVGDDCIAIKSGKYYMSEQHHRPSERIVVRNCILERGHGSVTIGSEAASGVREVEVSRCIFEGTDRGLRIKTRRGRGPEAVYDEIRFHDIEMRNVEMPFTLNMFYFCDPDGHSAYVQSQEFLPADKRTPRIGTILGERIRCTGARGCGLVAYGLPERCIEKIILRDVSISFVPESERQPQQTIMMDNFPEMSGKSIYARNVEHLVLDNLRISGSRDTEPELENVIEYDSKNVIFDM